MVNSSNYVYPPFNNPSTENKGDLPCTIRATGALTVDTANTRNGRPYCLYSNNSGYLTITTSDNSMFKIDPSELFIIQLYCKFNNDTGWQNIFSSGNYM